MLSTAYITIQCLSVGITKHAICWAVIYLVNNITHLSNNVGQINQYPVDSMDCFINTCLLDWARTSEFHLHFSVMNVTATSFTQIKQV